MPALKGNQLNTRDLFFYRSYEDQYAAIISGNWKLIKYRSGKFELFNVVEDISEKQNRIGEDLAIEKELKIKLEKWETEAVPNY